MNENVEYDNTGDTTRDERTREAAMNWLARHPEASTTSKDLHKTVRQLITEIFKTGGRARDEFDAHAITVSAYAGVDPDTLVTLRTFTNFDLIPTEFGDAFCVLASAMAPLADAIQSLRRVTTDWAQEIAADRDLFTSATNPDGLLTRDDLRGFVVGKLRPQGVIVHKMLGPDQTSEAYASALTAFVPAIAEDVVATAVAERTAELHLTTEARANLEQCAKANIVAMSRLASRFGAEADDTLGDSLLKLTLAHRANPQLQAERSYARTVVLNAGRTRAKKHMTRVTEEFANSEVLALVELDVDNTLLVDVKDLIVRRVLEVAASLATNEQSREHKLAAEALLGYFIRDAKTGELGPEVLHMSDPDGREVRDGLKAIAGHLAPSKASATRVTKLAIAALRSDEVA